MRFIHFHCVHRPKINYLSYESWAFGLFPVLGYYQQMLLWRFLSGDSSTHVLNVFLENIPSYGTAESQKIYIYEKVPSYIPKWLYQLILLQAVSENSTCSISHQHWVFLDFFLVAGLIGVWWYFSGALMCIFLISNKVEHIFISLFTIQMFSL